MRIYTVKSGDTLSEIAGYFNVSASFLAIWNGLTEKSPLVVGQNLLILSPEVVYTVREGDTFSSVAASNGMDIKTLLSFNPNYNGGLVSLRVGDLLILSFSEPMGYPLFINGYAYPFITEEILDYGLPYLSYLTPFTYGFTEEGTLLSLNDEALLSAAFSFSVSPLLHLSTLTEGGTFSGELADTVLQDQSAGNRLIEEVVATAREKGYAGIDIDFEYISPYSAQAYADFTARMRSAAQNNGLFVIVALAPKTSDSQSGLLYEGHDYAALGAAADFVFLMTYEWGYTYGPPMAVAPILSVRRVLDYAITKIPANKILMGVPNYGYDWSLPYKKGETRAQSISNEEAVAIAARFGAEIRFDESAQTPYFNYYEDGTAHEVWFEDARSISAKLALIPEYGFRGVGYWNMMRKFTQNWMIAATQYKIQSGF